MTQGLTGIIFDKDGTLFDYRTTWEAWSSSVLLKLAGGDHEKASGLAQLIDFDYAKQEFLPQSIVIAGTPQEIAEALSVGVPEMDVGTLFDVLNEEAARAPQMQAAPLVPLLTDLRQRGLKLGVATNDAEAPALAHLDQAGVMPLFDFVAGSDSGFGAKPEPGQLLGFCKLHSLAPEGVAMVGDSLHDLKAGAAAGMVPIGVLTGMATEAALAPYARGVLPNIGHLPDWLNPKA